MGSPFVIEKMPEGEGASDPGRGREHHHVPARTAKQEGVAEALG